MPDVTYPGSTNLEDRAIREIVSLAMDAPAKAKSGHSGTAMALAPLGVTLFSRILRHDPTDPHWVDRDRFILSNGHASMLQYGLAHVFGYDLRIEDIEAFRQPHSRTPGHPEVGVTPTVEVTTGPLGQGIANGVGMALAERILQSDYGDDLVNHRTWVIAGDGCLEEGISHEAASFAGRQGLDRLTIFYDDNHITIDGVTELALNDDPAERFRAYGWHVIEVGEFANDLTVLERACRDAIAETERPTLIIVRSHIGFPSPEMMDTREAHGSPFSAAQISEVKKLLGVPDEPFVDDEELPSQLLASISANRDERNAWEARLSASGERGQSFLARLASGGIEQPLPTPVPFDKETSVATRKALQRAFDGISATSQGIVAGSADLTDNTGVTLSDTSTQSKQSPNGRQIHYGIREHAMGAIMVGMALHGGVRPVGSTFFVFSDYMRPSIRLASLSHAPVLFVFTHDSVGVGEDGPTHQPVEHLMSLRAMPNLHVVRPSDANETLQLVRHYFSKQVPSPTALVLTRQDIPVLKGNDAAASKKGAEKGGYVLRERDDARITLMATGSEVGVALAASDTLALQDVPNRVVALPCWECFDEQPAEYRDDVLRRSIPSVAIEAGSTLGWYKYATDAIGIDTFGLSAPASFVFDYYNINAETLVRHVHEMLED